MKRCMIIILLCLLHYIQYGQFNEDFQDGDLINNPSWAGDVQDFIVNDNFQLQLNAAEAGNSLLYIESSYPDSVEWNFFFNMDFSPSGSNQLRIYLISSSTNISDTEGYFFEIGESGSSDALNFYRQDGTDMVLLAMGSMGALASAPALARVQILRHGDGLWEIKADYSGGSGLQTEFELIDDTYGTNLSANFILYCSYSDSRKDRYFFDDCLLAKASCNPRYFS